MGYEVVVPLELLVSYTGCVGPVMYVFGCEDRAFLREQLGVAVEPCQLEAVVSLHFFCHASYRLSVFVFMSWRERLQLREK